MQVKAKSEIKCKIMPLGIASIAIVSTLLAIAYGVLFTYTYPLVEIDGGIVGLFAILGLATCFAAIGGKKLFDIAMGSNKIAIRKPPRQTRGSKIFIGHGHSLVWRELKDFIIDSLKLPYDEFNAQSVAGIPTATRLNKMLDDAVFAFLVLTAEDQRADGAVQARMNVVHEAGLFQGRLGFEKAIILIEEGCEQFSNITGLGQIQFPSGSIKSAFEEIRRVLEREKIIQKN